jgi:HAD superfamily hydrolase (TIGR01509 family)
VTRRRFDAVIFDMDGVIADSEPVYAVAFNAVLEPRGYHLDEDTLRRLMGHGMREAWEFLQTQLDIDDLEAVSATYDASLPAALAHVQETLPGVRELIRAVEARGLRLGLGSSSKRAWIDALLGGVGLTRHFQLIVTAEDVEHAKPAPDIYRRVAELMGVAPAHCLVIEDTPAGVESAKSAGMFVVQTRSASSAFPPIEGADVVLPSLLEFDVRLLDGA